MNIVMFTDAFWPRVNGVTVSVDSYSRALVRAGHRVMVICSSYPGDSNDPASPSGKPASLLEDNEGRKIVRVPSIPVLISKEDRIAKIDKWFWVFKQTEQFNPDIIHINTEFVISEFGLLYARVHNLPAIYTFHTMWEDYAPMYFPIFPPAILKFIIREAYKKFLNRCYRVIVPTLQIDEVVHKYRPMAKTFLHPTGIEKELFQRTEDEALAFREKLEGLYPQLKGKRILLFAGRAAKEKNIGFLFRMLPAILARHPDAILLIVGNGPDLDYFREDARKAGVEEACVFTGYMERKDLALAYAISEVFVFPSMTDTQGLVTLEAMLAGTPVVAIGALGTLMVMNGDNGGFMVKNDLAEFTARVLDLLDDQELRSRKSLEAKEHALPWCIDELTKKLEIIYETTVASYREERGEPRIPKWKSVRDKGWEEVVSLISKSKAVRKWQEILSKIWID